MSGINPGESIYKSRRKTPANDNFFVKDRSKHRKGSGVVPSDYVWRKSYQLKGKTVPGRYVKQRGSGKGQPSKKKTPSDDNFFRKNRNLHTSGSGVVPKDYRWKRRREYMRKGKKVVVPGRWVPPKKKKPAKPKSKPSNKNNFDKLLSYGKRTVKVNRSKGYSGKTSEQGWVAEIIGTSALYGLDRKFLEPDDIDWGSSQLYKKSKGTWDAIYELGSGLYEINWGAGEGKEFYIVWPRVDKDRMGFYSATTDQANKIAKYSEKHLFEEAIEKYTKLKRG